MAEDIGGRPNYPESQYKSWLEELRPYLVKGCSLNYAVDKSGLNHHRTTIYEKYRLKDWFSHEIDELRSKVGETVNDILATEVFRIQDKQKGQGAGSVTKDELEVVEFVAKHHRTAQPFFATRSETAETKPEDVGKILDRMESNYDNLGSEIEKQSVAANSPVQNQEQTGTDSNVPAQPNAVEVNQGAGSA